MTARGSALPARCCGWRALGRRLRGNDALPTFLPGSTISPVTQLNHQKAKLKKVLPVAVVGCGRMGRLHARVYTDMDDVNLVGVYDANHEKAHEVADEFGCKAFPNLKDLLPQVAGASVCVPTKHHGAL